MASNNSESLEFEFEQLKEKSKTREEELVTLVKERDKEIGELEQKLLDTNSQVELTQKLLASETSASIEPTKNVRNRSIEAIDQPVNNTDSVLAELQRQLNKYRQNLKEKEHLLMELKEKFEELDQQNFNLQEDNNKLSDEMMDYVYENEILAKKCEDYAEQIKSTVVPIKRLTSDNGLETEDTSLAEANMEYTKSIINELLDAHPGHTLNGDHHLDNEEHDSASKTSKSMSEQLATEKNSILQQICNFENLNTELTEQINKYELTKKDLMLRLEELGRNLSAADEKNLEYVNIIEKLALSKTDLEDQLNNAKERLVDLEATKSNATRSNKESEERYETLKLEILTLKNQLSGFQMERKLFEEERSVFNQLEKELSDDAQEARSKLGALEKHKREWESIILQSEEDIIKLKEQVTQLQDQLLPQVEKEATDEKLVRIEEETKYAFESKIDDHIQVISSLKKKNAELCESLKDFDKVKVEFQQQQALIESTKRQLDEKDSQMVQIRSKLHADDYEMLKVERDSLRQLKDDLLQQTGDLEQQVMSLREAQEKLTADIKRLTNEKNEHEKQVIDFREQLEKMIESERELQNSLTQFKNSNQSLESENMEVNDLNISLEITLNELNDANTVLLQEKSIAIDENLSLNERIKNLSYTLESHAMLKVERDSLKKINDDISQQTSDMKQQNMMLEEQHDKLRADMKRLTNEKDENEKQVNALREQLEKSTQSEQELQNLLTQYKNSNQSLESEFKEVKDLNNNLKIKEKELNEVNAVLIKEKSVAMDENVSLNERISNLSNTLESLQKCNADLKEMDAKHLTEIKILNELNIKLMEDLDALQVGRAKTEQEFREANNECSILRLSLENAKHQVQECEKELEDLKQSMNKTCDNLLELQQERDALLDMKEQQESEFQRKLVEECELTVADLTNARSQNLVLSDKVDGLTLEKEQLEASLNQSAERALNLSDEVNVLQKKLERFGELERRYAESKLENENLKDSITKSDVKIKRYQNELELIAATHKEQVEKAKVKLSQMKSKLEVQIQQFNRTRKENDDLKQEIHTKETEKESLLGELKLKNTENNTAVKEKERLLNQLHEMQKIHVLKIEQYEQKIQTFKSQIVENCKDESSSRSPRHGYSEPEKQIIKRLLGENNELMLKNQSITVELDESRKISQKNRKTKRYSNHDESRALAWCNHPDVGTMTTPTDQLCNCEKLDKELMEAKKSLRIKDCQINTLRMESKMNPLKDEIETFKHRIENEETKKMDMHKELKELRLKMSELYKEAKSSTDCDPCIRRSRAAFTDRCSQTDEEAKTRLEDDHNKLQNKYEDLKRMCKLRNSRIAALENQLVKKGNEADNMLYGNINTDNNSSDGVIKELAIVRTKYEEAKNLIGFLDTKIKSLEAELVQSSSGTVQLHHAL